MYNQPFPVNTNDIHQRKLILILPFLIGPFVFWQAGRIFIDKSRVLRHLVFSSRTFETIIHHFYTIFA